MNRRLLWKMCLTIAAGTVLMYAAIHLLAQRTELGMSHLAERHQQELLDYGAAAERLYRSGDTQALEKWLAELELRESTWAAVVAASVAPVAGVLSQRFLDEFGLGRNVEWQIHLYFEDNPIMEVAFANRDAYFLILLPDRMRPGAYLRLARLGLEVGLPLVLLIGVSYLLYRHVMRPLRQLHRATRQLAEGHYTVRVRESLGTRNDEIAELADAFDGMAQRTGSTIETLRRLIADLSHELRTPLTRIDMALQCGEHGLAPKAALERIGRESARMRRLVDDSLMLAWLENEKPQLRDDSLDLVDLLDALMDDAAFEYPDRNIVRALPDSAPLARSSQRALAQAIENVLRNALRHTPPGGNVLIRLTEAAPYRLTIADNGPGVPERHLEDIFKPFFRLDSGGRAGGFGLGLALARRQIEAAGARIAAANGPRGGLEMTIRFA